MLVLLEYLHVPPRKAFPSELSYVTPNSRKKPLPLPKLSSAGTVSISVVVPAYNEESRIQIMLAEAVNYLEKVYSRNKDWEILVVDDGSVDNTSNVVLDWATQLQKAGTFTDGQLRVCKLERNRGKGGAVSHVPLSHRLILMNRACNMFEDGM
jgi:dolichyl-phosphate beta-glucosyltransferase